MKIISYFSIFLFLIIAFTTQSRAVTDSTSISLHLKRKQSTGLYYYDSNYQNKRIMFVNDTDSSIVITRKVLLDLPTEFRHSTIHRISGIRTESSQHIYLEPATASDWYLTDNYDMAALDTNLKYSIIEDIDSINVSPSIKAITFSSKNQLNSYLVTLASRRDDSINEVKKLFDLPKMRVKQRDYLLMMFECDYYVNFLEAIARNPKLRPFFKGEIDNKIKELLSRTAYFEQVRFRGILSAGGMVLSYLSNGDIPQNFNKISAFALENLGKMAIPVLFSIASSISDIGNNRYKSSIEDMKKHANPFQRHYIEVITQSFIDQPETHLLNATSGALDKSMKDILEENKGRLILIDFWASWCIPCRAEMPVLRKMEKTFNKEQIVFIGISLDENDKIKEWLAALKMENLIDHPNQYRLVSPKSSKLTYTMNLHSIPKYVLLGRDGKILNKDFLRPSDQKFESELSRYLQSF